MMEAASLRILAGIGGALLGFAGVVGLVVALGITIAPALGAGVATLVCASLLLAAALGCVYFALSSHEEHVEPDQVEHSGPLSSIPLELIGKMIEEKPLVTIGAAIFLGYAVTQRPELATTHVQKFLEDSL